MSLAAGGERLVIPCTMLGNDVLAVSLIPFKPDTLRFMTDDTTGVDSNTGISVMLDRAGVELLSRELLVWLHTYKPG